MVSVVFAHFGVVFSALAGGFGGLFVVSSSRDLGNLLVGFWVGSLFIWS